MDNSHVALIGGLLVFGACDSTSSKVAERGGGQPAFVRDFEGNSLGSTPSEWRVGQGAWRVANDASSPSGSRVLQQTESNDETTFNIAWLESSAFTDGRLSVALKPVGGVEDQGGGLVWRARDERNYYVARWNPLERNLRAYKVVDGKRTQLASVTLEVTTGWHTLAVTVRGSKSSVTLDGQHELETNDSTFAGTGAVGLWTKADATTNFDALSVTTGKP